MKTYLRPNQIAELESEKRVLEKQLESPFIQEKGLVASQLRRLKQNVETQTPPEVSGPDLDKVAKREVELREKIQEGMPSAEEMRRCPPGAIGRHMKWERANKERILEWKNCRLIMNRGSDDPDIANVEQLRSWRSTQHNLDGSLIEGKNFSFPSDDYKENYDEAFAKVEPETPEEQAERLMREVAELRAELDARHAAEPQAETELPQLEEGVDPLDRNSPESKRARMKTYWTPERRAAQSRRAKAMQARKREEALQKPPEPQTTESPMIEGPEGI